MINFRPADGLGTQLRRLLELLDGDLEEIYRGDGQGYRPRFTPVMKALADAPELSIKDIAEHSSISHSAASQTLAKMAGLEFVETKLGRDGRERIVRLSKKGRSLLPLLRRRWAATQQAADELDAELETPLSRALAAAIDALIAEPFQDRVKRAEKSIKEAV